MKYSAFVVEEIDAEFVQSIQTLDTDSLPEGEVLVRVEYSSLNYKDALSATGNKGITKKYPHTPGIDAAGVVVSSASRLFSEGDKVIVSGNDLGMNTPGGFGQYIRVPAAWVVALPSCLPILPLALLLAHCPLTGCLVACHYLLVDIAYLNTQCSCRLPTSFNAIGKDISL